MDYEYVFIVNVYVVIHTRMTHNVSINLQHNDNIINIVSLMYHLHVSLHMTGTPLLDHLN